MRRAFKILTLVSLASALLVRLAFAADMQLCNATADLMRGIARARDAGIAATAVEDALRDLHKTPQQMAALRVAITAIYGHRELNPVQIATGTMATCVQETK
jgi:hypothetical protein